MTATEMLIRALTTESPRPRRVREHRLAPWLVVATVSVGAFMGQLDASIVSLALPRVGRAFAVGPGVAAWVSLSYLLVLVCALPLAGRLADRAGRKRLYVQGFVLFSAASLACGLAPDLGTLIAARCLQGLGAALLQANSVALIRECLDGAPLSRALGIQGAAQAAGLAGGPALGGLLLALGGWRLLFLVNVPAGVVGGVAGVLLLPRSRTRGGPGGTDWGGALLLALAAGGLLAALSLAREPGAGIVALALVAAAVACGGALAAVERRAPAPLLDLALLSRWPLASALGAGLVAQMALFGTLVAVPFELAAGGVGAARAGLELAALPVALGIAAPLAGRVADRLGARRMAAAGLGLAGAGLGALALGGSAPALRIAALAVAGSGFGAFVPVNNATIMRSAATGRAGAMSGLLNMTRGVGTALGIALASLLYGAAPGWGGALSVLAAVTLLTAAALARLAGGPGSRTRGGRGRDRLAPPPL